MGMSTTLFVSAWKGRADFACANVSVLGPLVRCWSAVPSTCVMLNTFLVCTVRSQQHEPQTSKKIANLKKAIDLCMCVGTATHTHCQ